MTNNQDMKITPSRRVRGKWLQNRKCGLLNGIIHPQHKEHVIPQATQLRGFLKTTGPWKIQLSVHGDTGGTPAQDNDPVPHDQGIVDVVGHEKHGLLDESMHVDDFFAHLHVGQKIQTAERFIHDHDVWIDRQGPCQLGTPLHASGELPGVVVFEAIQLNHVDKFENLCLLLPTVFQMAQPERDVFGHGHPGEQTTVLENENMVRGRSLDGLTIDPQRSIACGLESGDNPQQRRFPTTGRSQKADHFTIVDLKIDILENRDALALLLQRVFLVAGPPSPVDVGFAQIFNCDMTHGDRSLMTHSAPTGTLQFSKSAHQTIQGQPHQTDDNHSIHDEIHAQGIA
ncbi:hypothetical protein DESC_340052 [Desulfosarcina cetonica]|nr:hypothetical protein DESC_340052 [Desulfosarcina cetonica]